MGTLNQRKTFLFAFQLQILKEKRSCYTRIIKRLGGNSKIGEDLFVADATHILVPDHIIDKWCPKLIGGLASGKHIVKCSYLEDSQKAGKFLDEANYIPKFVLPVVKFVARNGKIFQGIKAIVLLCDDRKQAELKLILREGGAEVPNWSLSDLALKPPHVTKDLDMILTDMSKNNNEDFKEFVRKRSYENPIKVLSYYFIFKVVKEPDIEGRQRIEEQFSVKNEALMAQLHKNVSQSKAPLQPREITRQGKSDAPIQIDSSSEDSDDDIDIVEVKKPDIKKEDEIKVERVVLKEQPKKHFVPLGSLAKKKMKSNIEYLHPSKKIKTEEIVIDLASSDEETRDHDSQDVVPITRDDSVELLNDEPVIAVPTVEQKEVMPMAIEKTTETIDSADNSDEKNASYSKAVSEETQITLSSDEAEQTDDRITEKKGQTDQIDKKVEEIEISQEFGSQSDDESKRTYEDLPMEVEPELETTLEPKPDPKPESKLEPKPESKPESKPEPKIDTLPDIAMEYETTKSGTKDDQTKANLPRENIINRKEKSKESPAKFVTFSGLKKSPQKNGGVTFESTNKGPGPSQRKSNTITIVNNETNKKKPNFATLGGVQTSGWAFTLPRKEPEPIPEKPQEVVQEKPLPPPELIEKPKERAKRKFVEIDIFQRSQSGTDMSNSESEMASESQDDDQSEPDLEEQEGEVCLRKLTSKDINKDMIKQYFYAFKEFQRSQLTGMDISDAVEKKAPRFDLHEELNLRRDKYFDKDNNFKWTKVFEGHEVRSFFEDAEDIEEETDDNTGFHAFAQEAKRDPFQRLKRLNLQLSAFQLNLSYSQYFPASKMAEILENIRKAVKDLKEKNRNEPIALVVMCQFLELLYTQLTLHPINKRMIKRNYYKEFFDDLPRFLHETFELAFDGSEFDLKILEFCVEVLQQDLFHWRKHLHSEDHKPLVSAIKKKSRDLLDDINRCESKPHLRFLLLKVLSFMAVYWSFCEAEDATSLKTKNNYMQSFSSQFFTQGYLSKEMTTLESTFTNTFLIRPAWLSTLILVKASKKFSSEKESQTKPDEHIENILLKHLPSGVSKSNSQRLADCGPEYLYMTLSQLIQTLPVNLFSRIILKDKKALGDKVLLKAMKSVSKTMSKMSEKEKEKLPSKVKKIGLFSNNVSLTSTKSTEVTKDIGLCIDLINKVQISDKVEMIHWHFL